jgi:hypothetical protein
VDVGDANYLEPIDDVIAAPEAKEEALSSAAAPPSIIDCALCQRVFSSPGALIAHNSTRDHLRAEKRALRLAAAGGGGDTRAAQDSHAVIATAVAIQPTFGAALVAVAQPELDTSMLVDIGPTERFALEAADNTGRYAIQAGLAALDADAAKEVGMQVDAEPSELPASERHDVTTVSARADLMDASSVAPTDDDGDADEGNEAEAPRFLTFSCDVCSHLSFATPEALDSHFLSHVHLRAVKKATGKSSLQSSSRAQTAPPALSLSPSQLAAPQSKRSRRGGGSDADYFALA